MSSSACTLHAPNKIVTDRAVGLALVGESRLLGRIEEGILVHDGREKDAPCAATPEE